MIRNKYLGSIFGGALVVCIVLISSQNSFAETSSSNNFQITDTEFGSGTELETCSGQYCARASIGSLNSEDSSSGSKTASFGSIASDSEPMLEIIVEPGESNLGVLTTERTASKTTKVKIRSYKSGGYTLQLSGHSPKYQSHQLKTLTLPTASSPGVEQFGINVVSNSSPSIGADPVQVPSDLMSFGYPTEDYGVKNLFKYINGDEIARSDTESGQTEFTISMIVNISGSTPAGHFVGDFSAVVVPVF